MSKKSNKKKRPGRPPKGASMLDFRMHVAIDEQRNKRYRQAAETQGVDLSEWVRRACDAAADDQLGEEN